MTTPRSTFDKLPRPFSRSIFRPGLHALVAGALLLAVPAAALAQPRNTYRPGRAPETEKQQERRDTQDEGRELFRPSGGAQQGKDSQIAWSIVLLAFRGEMQQQDAMRGLATIQGEWGLSDAYVEKRGETTVVAFGRYDDPQHARAQADLKRIREMEVEIGNAKERPFEFAFLTPPADIRGTVPEFDLRNAQLNHGNWALYTLQIGIYRREDGQSATAAQIAEFRKLAEDAVFQLRRGGEQAFYYHGPSGSTVTLALFGIEDFDPQIRLESPRLRALRQQYPHNLLNGMGIKRRVTTTDQSGRQVQTERLDPSMLVAVPKARRR